jgi:glyoxylase-like metal-dependent hydrolase (beta-lactamase superfamily II)
MKPTVKEFFDKNTWTLTYIIYDESSKDAVVIDPVWDYDPAASKLSAESVEKLVDFIQDHQLKVHYILETHAHADHISGAQLLKQKISGADVGISKGITEIQVGIGKGITEVQKVFKRIFNLDPNFKIDGSQFDLMTDESKPLQAGTLKVETIFTPGHTPACASYVIGDAVFTGDAIFMTDSGTGRCDFPAGSAADLYHSIHEKLFKLPDHFRVFVGHDYQPNGRPLAFESCIGEQKQKNIHLNIETTQEQFVEFRNSRDKSLSAPRLLLPSVQVNINAGNLPQPENNGSRYLKIPVR